MRIADKKAGPTPTFFDVSAKFSSAWLQLETDGTGVCFGHWRVQLVPAASPVSLLQPPPRMKSKMDAAGDTATLKRKREPKDDAALAQKKHRRKAGLQDNGLSEDAASGNVKPNSSSLASQKVDSDLELSDVSLQPSAGPVSERLAAWKLSKPMGGRMLDIDPVFSTDER